MTMRGGSCTTQGGCLWGREYTVRGLWNNTKRTMQFKYEDVTFFKKNSHGQLQGLPRDTPKDLIASADSATLKLDNQKNGWKGVCIYHENNGNQWHCPVCALACHYTHLCSMGADAKTFLLAYYHDKGKRNYITNNIISRALKAVATVLDHPNTKGIPVDRINTHSLSSGGTNRLLLVGYSMKYLYAFWRECRLSTSMKQQLNFVDGN